jgi:hypothetical protein
MYVTAASSNHFKSAKQFIRSLNGAPLVFYDIGLTPDEASEIKGMSVEYRVFDWSNVPEWGLLTSPNAGSYVWKPIIIHEVYRENHELLIWCDAGNIVHNRTELENCVRNYVIYTGSSSGNVRRYTHETCVRAINVPVEYQKNNMRNAACVGFIGNNPICRQFIEDWKSYGLQYDIISGSRDNHRWDQSILTCLFYKYHRGECPSDVGFSIHNDCD